VATRFQDLERSMTMMGRRGPEAQYGLMANRGQSGGIKSISPQAKRDAFVNTQRGKFFDGRNVPEERVFRRTAQDTLDRQFMDRFTKPVLSGNPNSQVTGLVQMTADAPRSLAENRMALANRLGPTPSEIAGDAMRAIGNIGQQAGFIPFVSGAMKIGQGIKDFAQKAIDFGKQFAPDMGGVSDFFRPAETDLSARILALSPTQRQFYDRLVSDTTQNISVQEALRRAEAMGMAMGGIATLQ
tara:strand:- start:15 stop:740 length:726 start_codon:yes stop_codon:yes gene_type:complete